MKIEILKKEIGIYKILFLSIKIYFKNFFTILLVILFTYFPYNIISAYLITDKNIRTKDIVLTVILLIIVTSLATSTLTFIVDANIRNKKIVFSDAMNKSLDRIVAFFSTSIFALIALLLMLAPAFIYSIIFKENFSEDITNLKTLKHLGLLFILSIPYFNYLIFWIFSPIIAILKNKSCKNALRYSKEVVKKRWWKVAIYTFIFWFIFCIIILFLNKNFSYSLYKLLPESIIPNILINTFLNFVSVYFLTVFVVFFINFDATKKL